MKFKTGDIFKCSDDPSVINYHYCGKLGIILGVGAIKGTLPWYDCYIFDISEDLWKKRLPIKENRIEKIVNE